MARARKQPHAEADIRKMISQHGLDDHAGLILSGLRRSVRLKPGKPAKRRLPAGTSKFGGEPDLPKSAQWPTFEDRPLHFVAQFDLAGLPPRYIPSADLPRKGLLSFWYDTQGDRTLGLRDIDSMGRYRVLYHTGHAERRSFPHFDGQAFDKDHGFFFWRPFPERRVTLEPMWTLDEGVHDTLDKRWLSEGCSDAFDHTGFIAKLEVEGSGMSSRLLGSYWDQYDQREDAAEHAARARKKKPRKHDHAQWRLLALFDSDRDVEDWMWGDEGHLGFWIRDADLKANRFDRIYGSLFGC